MPERPSEEEAIDRIQAIADEGLLLSVAYTGHSQHYWYYLAVVVKEYDGQEYLNERYVQLVKDPTDEYSDTFKKNGINRRVPEGARADRFANALSVLYEQVSDDVEEAMFDPDSSIIGELPRYTGVED